MRPSSLLELVKIGSVAAVLVVLAGPMQIGAFACVRVQFMPNRRVAFPALTSPGKCLALKASINQTSEKPLRLICPTLDGWSAARRVRLETQTSRKATMGSTRMARRAGI
jgi:hypothetical protein